MGIPMRNGTSRWARASGEDTMPSARASNDAGERAMDMNGDPQVGSRSIGRLQRALKAGRAALPREIWIPPLQPPDRVAMILDGLEPQSSWGTRCGRG